MNRVVIFPIILLISMGAFVPAAGPLFAASSDTAPVAAPGDSTNAPLLYLSINAAQNNPLFTKDLHFGMPKDPQVSMLQAFLTTRGDYSGPISGNFFSLTLAAVKQFQIAQGIAPATGYFGGLTRDKANAILSAQSQTPAGSNSTPATPAQPALTDLDASALRMALDSLIQMVALLQKQLAIQEQADQLNRQKQLAASLPPPAPPIPPPPPPVPCSYPAAPSGCSYVPGTTYNASTTCGEIIYCSFPPAQMTGPTTISAIASPTTPPPSQLVMGSTGNPLAVFRLTETSVNENAEVSDLTISDSVSPGARASFASLSLTGNGRSLGTAVPVPGPAANTYMYTFTFSPVLVVPLSGPVTLTLKGDVLSSASGSATDNSTHTFSITNMTALGQSLRGQAVIFLNNASGYKMTVLRSTLSINASFLGITAFRPKTTNDDIATITFGASSGGDITLNNLTLTFSGSAINAQSTQGISLLDSNKNDITLMSGVTSSTASVACTAGSCKKWTFGGNGFVIAAGKSYTFTLRMNTASSTVIIPGGPATFMATIQNTGDVQYADGLDVSATSGLTPMMPAVPAGPALAVPFNITGPMTF